MTDYQAAAPISPRGLLVAGAGAVLVAGVIVFGAILPAEYGRDPFGLGEMTGLLRLWAPADSIVDTATASGPLARTYSTKPRSDVIEIPLGYVGGDAGPYSLEYKVRMARDATLVYDWEVVSPEGSRPAQYDFHGHTVSSDPKKTMTVAEYSKASAQGASGALVAPFDGIHGWYFENPSTRPMVIRIRLSGFYSLVPTGEPGNEAGVVANVPALKASTSAPPR